MFNTIQKYDNDAQRNREVILFEYENNVIDYVTGVSYFNGTQMAAVSGKVAKDWLKYASAAEDIFLTALELGRIDCTETQNPCNNVIGTIRPDAFYTLSAQEKVKYVKDNNYFGLVRSKKGGDVTRELTGTFIHQHLAIQFAQWCNPLFRLQVSKWVQQLLTKGKVILEGEKLEKYEQYLKEEEYGVPAVTKDFKNEQDIAFRIKCWIDLCVNNSRINIEHPILNTLNKQTRVRRFDFIQINPRNIVIYELKKHKITPKDILETVADRGYLELVRQQYGKPCSLIFLSPAGINDHAELLLKEMKNVSFKAVSDLCKDYYIKGVTDKWKDNVVNINELAKSETFCNLFTQEFLKMLQYKGVN